MSNIVHKHINTRPFLNSINASVLSEKNIVRIALQNGICQHWKRALWVFSYSLLHNRCKKKIHVELLLANTELYSQVERHRGSIKHGRIQKLVLSHLQPGKHYQLKIRFFNDYLNAIERRYISDIQTRNYVN